MQQGCKISSVTTKLDFINIPVLANFYVAKGFALKIGLQPGFLVNAEENGVDYKDVCNTFNLSLPIGLSYEFANGITLDLRGAASMTNLIKDSGKMKWYADGQEVHVGDTIDKAFEAGDYQLKIEATTVQGKKTSREMKLTVSPLDGDPVAGNDIMERYQEAGTTVTLSGSNMAYVAKVKINGREMDVTSATADHIQYTIPADIPEGQYRLSLINAEGVSYGGGIVNISGQAIVTESVFISALPGQLTFSGRKLDEVAAVAVNGQPCTIVSQQADKLVVELPALADGNYTMQATTKSGANVMFIKDGAIVLHDSVDNIRNEHNMSVDEYFREVFKW